MKHGKHPFLRDLKENRVKWLMLLPAAFRLLSAGRSVMVFHAWQAGHCPAHLGSSFPHSVQ